MHEKYVEKYIDMQAEKIWDAYLAIDIKEKSGYEEVPRELCKLMVEARPYLGFVDFFKSNRDKEVYLTDDVFPIKDSHDAWSVLHAIIGNDVIVHIRTTVDALENTKTFFEEALREHVNPIWLLIDWIYLGDNFLLQIRKRVDVNHDNILRLYADGSGVIIHYDPKQYKTFYFVLKEDSSDYILRAIEKKIDDIVANPLYLIVDDREYGFSLSVEYNLKWKYPDLPDKCDYDNKEYSNDENKLKIVEQLLSLPEISSAWEQL